jgi:gamma-glutamyltranspeptidase/glutathione hydrolase
VNEGLTLIPGSGHLASVVPGAFDGWMVMLLDHGSLRLRDVLEPALHYARHGHPILPRVSQTITGLAGFFQTDWPTSYDTWLPGGEAPAPGSMFRNPCLGDMWDRLLTEAETQTARDAQIERARHVFAEGFVAEAIDRFVADAAPTDSTGQRRKGVLQASDMAAWRAGYETPVSCDYDGWRIFKPGFWSQGPVLLQALNILNANGFTPDAPAETVHATTEALKLALADREAYYGDADEADLDQACLLSDGYAALRRLPVEASLEMSPGCLSGVEALAKAAVERSRRQVPKSSADVGEPTMAHLRDRRGDTVHLDVIDRWGNAVSATPSGGWLQSNPVVPGLGVPLNTRAQMFWLDPGLPTSLKPGRRPRTTLSPSMALGPDGARLAFGTPGGDQQDQWQLLFFLRLAHGEHSLQAAIDAPLWHTGHLQGSFYPRPFQPGHLMIEPSIGEDAISALRALGHDVTVAEPWSVGRLTAAERAASGVMRAAATPRLMQAYAIGR